MYGSTQDDKIGHFSKAVLKAIKWNKVIKTAMYVFDNFYMYWGESKMFQSICAHYETIISLQHLCQVIVIFSAPAIPIIWTATSTLSRCCHHCLSEPILETADILWGVNGFHTWACMAYLFILSLDVPPLSRHPSELQLAVYCKTLKIFFNY